MFGQNNNNNQMTFSFDKPATSTSQYTTTSLSTSSTTPANNTTFSTFASAPTASNTLFGAPTSYTPTNTLFASNSTAPANNAFAQTNINTSGSANQPHFLDLPQLFTDSNSAPYMSNQSFSSNTSQFFTQEQVMEKPRPRRSPYEKPVVLPPILTASEPNILEIRKSNSNKVSRIRRLLEEDKAEGYEKSQKGIFGQSDTVTSGFNRNLKMLEESNHIPTKSIHDVGIIPTYLKDEIQSSAYDTTVPKSLLEKSPSSSKMRTRVRVFGFDDNNVQHVISLFTKLGDLAENYTGHGNWITFNYTTPEAALKALSYHGMHADSGHLIGVVWDEAVREVEFVQASTTSRDLFKTRAGYSK